MTTVFLGGSRTVSRLNEEIRQRLENIVSQRFTIVVGDANGADKAMQRFLAASGYGKVVVYCSGSRCRNNVGGWQAAHVSAPRQLKGRDFYAEKDKKMADDADYGLMLWDGKSLGTVNNVLELLKRGKKSLVYFCPQRRFYPVRSSRDLAALIARSDEKSVRELKKKVDVTAYAASPAVSRELPGF